MGPSRFPTCWATEFFGSLLYPARTPSEKAHDPAYTLDPKQREDTTYEEIDGFSPRGSG